MQRRSAGIRNAWKAFVENPDGKSKVIKSTGKKVYGVRDVFVCVCVWLFSENHRCVRISLE